MARGSWLTPVFSVMIVCFAMLSQGSGNGMNEACTTIFRAIGSRQVKTLVQCTKKIEKEVSSQKELDTRYSCVLKCMMETGGMLDEKGTVTEKLMAGFLQNAGISEDLAEFAVFTVSGCIEEYNVTMLTPDENCKAHGEFFSCVQDFMSEVMS